MSYSFSIITDNKDDATKQIREKFDEVVVSQPTHVADREAAVVAGQTLVRLLEDPKESEEIVIQMNGYLSWRYNAPDEFTQASLTITTIIRSKPTPLEAA